MGSTRFASLGLSILVHAALLGAAMLQFATRPEVRLGDDSALRAVEHSLAHDRPAPREAAQKPSAPQTSSRDAASPRATTRASDPHVQDEPAAPLPLFRISLSQATAMPPLPAPDETPSAIRTQLPLPPRPILEAPSATPQSEAADHGNAAAAGAPGDAKRTLQHEARSNYAGTVHRHISRYKGFPSELSRKGIEGTVMTRLTLAPGGRLGTVEILRSSGSVLLDRLAVKQIRLAAPFPRPPMALRAMRLSFLVPMVYSAHD